MPEWEWLSALIKWFGAHQDEILVPVATAVIIGAAAWSFGVPKRILSFMRPVQNTLPASTPTSPAERPNEPVVPLAVHDKTVKELGITEERYNQLAQTLENNGIPPHEAPVRIPELMAKYRDIEQQLENAPKTDAATDDLRAEAEEALSEGDTARAKELLQRAEKLDAQATHQLQDEAKDHAEAAAASANALAEMEFAEFNFKAAAVHYQRVVDYTADTDVKAHIEALNWLGRAYREALEFSQAEQAYKTGIERAERERPPEAALLATLLSNLAALYQATNRLDEAEPLMERALKIDEDALGPDHPDVAIRLNNLAQLYKATNRLDEAEPLMERALKIDEIAFRPDHPKVAIRLNNLAQLYQVTNRFTEAEPLMERALKIDEDAFGPDHPNVARDLNNLAQLYQATNRLDEAEPLMERAHGIFLASYGAEHPQTQVVAQNLNILRREIAARLGSTD